MFDTTSFRRILPRTAPVDAGADDFARRCREPAELWELRRRQWRPAPDRSRLPRVVAL